MEEGLEIVNSAPSQIEEYGRRSFHDDFGFGFKGFEVIVDTHAEDQNHRYQDAYVVSYRKTGMKCAGYGKVG